MHRRDAETLRKPKAKSIMENAEGAEVTCVGSNCMEGVSVSAP